LTKAVAPLKEALEPWKTHEGDFERGVPKSHDKYDCQTMKEDP